MYLLLKELGPKAEETIMAFASLVKDVNSTNEINRANSIRVICGLMDVCLRSLINGK
jgi:coatomer protein complex subunit gamma